MKTKIYGASDDLIEIEGEIEDEVGAYNKKSTRIECSDGTKAVIKYIGGIWRIVITEPNSLFNSYVPAVGDDKEHTDPNAIGCSSYSDVLVFKEGIEWIKIGSKKFNV